MSTTVDNRVVEMQFDNKEFEKGVKQTMNSLDELKKKLEFKNVHAGTDELEKSFLSMSGIVQSMQNDVAKLTNAFTGLWGTLRRHTIDKIAVEIEGGMKKIYNAIAGEGMAVGKSKYEQKMTAMRTIMAATHREANDVEGVLKVLMEYSDMTSYSFSEMVNYIGTFTAKGVELETAEKAMEGIANACARAGINTREAGRAMINFAQTISTHMTATDWKSLETMGFATSEFMNEVIKSAVKLGRLGEGGILKNAKGIDKGMAVTTANFRDMLHYGFMDQAVMLDVLDKFADRTTELGHDAYEAAKEAKSFTDAIEAIKDAISTGWSQSFELIFGNIEEAAKFFTSFCDTIIDDFVAPLNEARNALLSGWKEGGGRDSMLAALGNIWNLIMDIGGAIKNAWTSVFGSINSDNLISATDAIRGFIGQIRLWLYTVSGNGRMHIENLTNAIRGFLGVIKIAKLVIGGVLHFIGRVLGIFAPQFESFGDFLGDTGDSIANFADELEKNGTITKFFDKVADHIKPFIEWIKNLWNTITTSPIFKAIKDWLVDFVNTLPEKWAKVQEFFTDVWNKITNSPIFKKLSDKFKEFTDKLPETWTNIKNWFTTAWEEGGKTIGGFFQTVGGRMVDGVKKFIEDLPNKWARLKPKIAETGEKIGAWFSEIWAKIVAKFSGSTEGFKINISESWNKVKNWFTEKFAGISDFFRNLFGKTQNDVVKAAVGSSGGSATDTLEKESNKKTGFLGVLEEIGNFFSKWVKGFPTRITIYLALAAIIFWKIASGIKNVRKSIQAVQKTNLADVKKGGFFKAMVGLALALGALAAVIHVVSQIPSDGMTNLYIILGGLFGAIILMSAVFGLSKTAESIGKMFTGIGIAFLGIGVAVAMITQSIANIMNMTDDKFWPGFWRIIAFIGAIGAIYTAMGIMISRLGGGKGQNLSASFGIVIAAMGIAVRLLLPVVSEVAEMPWKKALVGIGGVSVLLIAFGVAMAGLGSISSGGKAGVTLVSLLGAILLVRTLVYALKEIVAVVQNNTDGSINWGQPVIIAMGGMILIFAAIGYMFAQLGKVKKMGGTQLVSVVLMALTILGVCGTLIYAITALKDQPVEKAAVIIGGIAAVFAAIALLAFVAQHTSIKAAGVLVTLFGAIALGIVMLGGAIAIVISMSSGALEDLAFAITTIAYALNIFASETNGLTEARVNEVFGIIKQFALVFADLAGIDYSSVHDFSTNTYLLAVALNRYDKNTSGINYAKANQSLVLVNSIALAAMTFSKIKKVNTITNTIASLGSAIKLYYLSLKGIDMTQLGGKVDIQGITDMIVQLGQQLPEQEAFDAFDKGIQTGSLTQLALDIVSLGTALESLSTDVGSSDRSSIEYALQIFNQIKSLASAMPVDADIDTAFGTLHHHYETLGEFALDIEALATAIGSLATCFGDNAEEGKANVTDAVSAVKNLADIRSQVVDSTIGENLTALGDWIHSIAANSAWTNFVSSIGILGGNIKTMVDNLAESKFQDVKPDDLEKLKTLMNTITTMYGDIIGAAAKAENGNKLGLFTGLDNLLTAMGNTRQWNELVKSMPSLAKGIVEMAKSASSQDISDLTDTNLGKLSTILSSVSELYAGVSGGTGGVNFGKDFSDIAGGVIEMSKAVESEDVSKVTGENLGKVVVVLDALSTLYSGVSKPVTGDLLGITSVLKASAANAAWSGFVDYIPDVCSGLEKLVQSTSNIGEDDLTDTQIGKFKSIFEALTGIYSGITGEVTGAQGTGLGKLFTAIGANTQWATFADKIPDVASGITALSTAVREENFQQLTSDEIGTMKSLLEAVQGIYSGVTTTIKPGQGLGLSSLMNAVANNTAWAGFIDQFDDLAHGIWSMAETITSPDFREIKDDDIKMMGQVLDPIAKLYNEVIGVSISDSSGLSALMSAIAADTSWSSFTEGFKAVAEGIWAMAETVTSETFRDVKDEDIDRMVTVMGDVSDLYAKVIAAGVKPIEGKNGFSLLWGALDVWTASVDGKAGSEAWGAFVESFETLAGGMTSVAAAANAYDIDEHILDKFLKTLDALATVYMVIANGTLRFETAWDGSYYVPSGLDQAVLQNWSTFASNIGVIARDLAYVFKDIVGDSELIQSAKDAAPVSELFASFGTMLSTLAQLATVTTVAGDSRASNVLERLMSFLGYYRGEDAKSGGLLGFFTQLSEIVMPNTDNLTKLATAVGDVDKLIKGINGLSSFEASVNAVDFINIGSLISQYIGQGLSEGTEDGEYSIVDASSQVLDAITSTINTYGPAQMIQVGKNLSAGISQGIANYAHLPKNTMRNVMNSIISVARTIPLIKSPSRVMAEIGMYMVAGLSEGLRDESENAVDEMKGLMTELLNVTEWVAPSLADGVLSQKAQFAQAMEELGIAGEEALRDTLEIHSISPLFWGIGEWVPVSVARGVTSGAHALTEAGEHISALLERSVREGFAAFEGEDAKQWMDWFGQLSKTEMDVYVQEYPQMMAQLMKLYAKAQKEEGNPLFDFGKAVNTAVNQWGSLQSTLTKFGISMDLGKFSESDLGPEIAKVLADKMGLDPSTTEWLVDRITGTSAENLEKIFGGGGVNGWDLSGVMDMLGKGTDVGWLFNALGLDNLGEELWGKGLEVEEANISQINTQGTNNGANGTGTGAGGSSGAYGTNGVNTTPGGLKLTASDGYTLGDIVHRIDRLENAITSMQIVLDSGALVGSMGRAMDRQLGDYAMYAGRRN